MGVTGRTVGAARRGHPVRPKGHQECRGNRVRRVRREYGGRRVSRDCQGSKGQ